MLTLKEARIESAARERAGVDSLRVRVDAFVEQLDEDAAGIDHNGVREALKLAHFHDAALFGRLDRAWSEHRERRAAKERARFDAEKAARRAALPGRVAAMRKVLEGDQWSEDLRREFAYLTGEDDVPAADRGALEDLRQVHRGRVAAREEREAAEAERAAAAERQRAERARLASWRALPRETRAFETWLARQKLPGELEDAFRSFFEALRDADPQAPPTYWQSR
jgi:hypothetical protein